MIVRKNENGEIMICCVILLFIIIIFVFMTFICVASASLVNTVGSNDSRKKIVTVKNQPTELNPEKVQNKDKSEVSPEKVQSKDTPEKWTREEFLALMGALIAVFSGIAAVAVVPGKLLRVILTIILFSLSISLFFW